MKKLKKNFLSFPKIFYKYKFFKPTCLYIKKKIFSWFGSLKNFFCLDLFAGSGSLGLEAALRGCKFVILLEKNKKIFFYLRNIFNSLKLKNLKLLNYNFFYYINNLNYFFYDLVFIDSPYIFLKDLNNSIYTILNFLKVGSFIYLETIFEIDLIIRKFKDRIKVLKNDFFNKINFFLFIVL